MIKNKSYRCYWVCLYFFSPPFFAEVLGDGYIFPTFTRPDYTPSFGVAEYLEEASEELMMVARTFCNARKGLVEK